MLTFRFSYSDNAGTVYQNSAYPPIAFHFGSANGTVAVRKKYMAISQNALD